jgi:hypothetical protein
VQFPSNSVNKSSKLVPASKILSCTGRCSAQIPVSILTSLIDVFVVTLKGRGLDHTIVKVFFICSVLVSDVACFFFNFWAMWSQWQPLKEVMNFRKLHLSNYLFFFFCSIIQFLGPFCRSLNVVVWRVCITRPAPSYATGAKDYHKYEDQDPFGYMGGIFF